MKKILFLFTLAVLPLFCKAQGTAPMTTPGILRINILNIWRYLPEVVMPTVYLKTEDQKIIDSISYHKKNEDYSFTKEIRSRVYFPEYSLMYFDCHPLENGNYKVFGNDQWYYINHVQDVTEFMTWEQFMLNGVMFFDTAPDNPLHSNPSIGSQVIQYDYSDVFFRPKQISGNWIYVDVLQGEEVIDPIGHGWIHWRDGNKFLIKTLYFRL